MIDSITKLIARELAYQGEDGSVYFDATRFPSYGALSGNRLDALKPGHRYEFTEGGAKRFHADWALWKAAGARSEMIWETPWGRGFPGWHIECSAMSLKYLYGKVDLHIGGIDLRFPHHEDERAQSNSLTPENGEAVSLWLHGEHLLFEGRKMSKSSGNVVLVSDVAARGIDPLAIRFCFMENRYRSQMDLSWNSIQAAHLVLERWRKAYQGWLKSPINQSERVDRMVAEIASAFNNDLDTPRAMISLRGIERGDLQDGEKRALFEALDALFGLDLLKEREAKRLTSEAEALLEKRKEARANRDFKLSDQLRDELALLGIEVRDTSEGQEWSWKIN
jgi:cysteinyl-tRNA synthetase